MKLPSIITDISHVKLLSEWIKAYQRKVKTNAIPQGFAFYNPIMGTISS